MRLLLRAATVRGILPTVTVQCYRAAFRGIFGLDLVVSNYPVVCSQDLQTSHDVPFESQPLDGEVADAAVVLDEDGKELGPAPKSRKKQSAVWNFYGPRYTSAKDGRVCVKCRLCEEEFAYVNTTNMHNHLVRKHKGDVLQDMITGKNVSRLLSCVVLYFLI